MLPSNAAYVSGRVIIFKQDQLKKLQRAKENKNEAKPVKPFRLFGAFQRN